MDNERNWGRRDSARIKNVVLQLQDGFPHHTLDRSAARYKLGLTRHEVTQQWRESGPHLLIREFDLSRTGIRPEEAPTAAAAAAPEEEDEPPEGDPPPAEDDQPSPLEEAHELPSGSAGPARRVELLPPSPSRVPQRAGGVQLRPAPPAFPPPGLPLQPGSGYWQDRRGDDDTEPVRRVRARGGRGSRATEDRAPQPPVVRRPRSFSVSRRRTEDPTRGGYPSGSAGSGAAASSSSRPVLTPRAQAGLEFSQEEERAAAAARATRRPERPPDTRGSIRADLVPEVAGPFRLPPPLSLEEVENDDARARAVGSSFLIALDVHGCLDSFPSASDSRAGAFARSKDCWFQKTDGDWENARLPVANIRAIRSVHFDRHVPIPVFLLSYVGNPAFAHSQQQADRSENHARSVFALRRGLAEELGLLTRQEGQERSIRDHWQSFGCPGGDRLYLRLIHQRTGRSGKASEALENGCPVIIDDRDDIVWEADALGLLAYQVGNTGRNAYSLERVLSHFRSTDPPCHTAAHIIHSHQSFVQALAHAYSDIRSGRATAKIAALRRYHNLTPITPQFPWGTQGADWTELAAPADTQLAIQGTRARRRR